jgi:hypothetical protein
MSDDISEPGKISKNYSESLVAYCETTFDESISEVDQHRSKDMSDDIPDSGKISKN